MWEVKTQNTYRPYTDLLFIDILSTDQRHHNYPLRDPEALEPDHSRVNQAVMPPQNSVGEHDRLELIDLFRDSADVVGIEVYFDGEMTFEDALRGGNGGYPQHYSHAVVGRP